MSNAILELCWPLSIPGTAKSVLISLADQANEKATCWPSISLTSERTGFSKRAVIDAIKWLEINLALVANRENGRHTSYRLTPEQYIKPVRESNRCGKVTGASVSIEPVHMPHKPVQMAPKPVRELHTNPKEPSITVTKSNPKGEVDFVLPDWIPESSWQQWLDYRKGMKKPIVNGHRYLQVKKLEALRVQGFGPITVIENAIEMGWRGLYAPQASVMAKAKIAQAFGDKTYESTPDDELPEWMR